MVCGTVLLNWGIQTGNTNTSHNDKLNQESQRYLKSIGADTIEIAYKIDYQGWIYKLGDKFLQKK